MRCSISSHDRRDQVDFPTEKDDQNKALANQQNARGKGPTKKNAGVLFLGRML